MEKLGTIDKSRVQADVDQLLEWVCACQKGALEFKQSNYAAAADKYWTACVLASQMEPRDHKKIRDLWVKTLRNRVRSLKKLPSRQLEALGAVDTALKLQSRDTSLYWLRGMILSDIFLWKEAVECLTKGLLFVESNRDRKDINSLIKKYNHHIEEGDFFYDIFTSGGEGEKKLRALTGKEFASQLKRKYRKLSLTWHPDKVLCHVLDYMNKDAARLYASSVFKIINEAYETLNDIDKRKAYDQKIMYSQPRPTYTEKGRGKESASSYDPYSFKSYEPHSRHSSKHSSKQPCWNYEDTGYCRYGQKCRYRHDDIYEDLWDYI